MGLFFCGWIWFCKYNSVLAHEVHSKLVNEAARCGFYYLTCVIHYDGFVGFKCDLEIIMSEYDTGK